DDREWGGDGHAELDRGGHEDGLRDDQRGYDHADGHRGRERGDGVGDAVHGDGDVADRGGGRDVDHYRDRPGRERQPDSRRDGHPRRDAGGGQHADTAGGDDECERCRDRYAVVDGGGREDGVDDDRRDRRHADGHRGRERGDDFGDSIDGDGDLADHGGRDLDRHGDGAGRERQPGSRRHGHARGDTDGGEHAD